MSVYHSYAHQCNLNQTVSPINTAAINGIIGLDLSDFKYSGIAKQL